MAWKVAPAKDEIALLMEAGFVYRDARKFQEARDVFRAVRALLPSSEVAEVALGTVCFEEADFAGAVKHYKTAIELNPNSGYAHAHLGEALLFRMDKEQARVHLSKALELEPRGEIRRLASSLIELTDEVKFRS
jgi:tetratricopeptide (TPR) repeat protein